MSTTSTCAQGTATPTLIEPSLRRADVVKLNREEAAILAAMFNLEEEAPQAVGRTLCSTFGLSMVCVTRGSAGCLLVSPSESVEEPGVSVLGGDPVGAGDAFTAATIWALLEGWPLARVARFANRFAALVAGSQGAMPVLGQALHDLQAGMAAECPDDPANT